MYSVGPYFMAKTLADAPVLFLTPLLSVFIVYFSVNLSTEFD
jgi:hypothetical protein